MKVDVIGHNRPPLFLVVNDDGIAAPGIQALAAVASRMGEVFVVAPEREHSGKSLAMSGSAPLRCRKVEGCDVGTQYAISGTPAECIKVGFYLLGDRRPDLVLSGINRGGNAAAYAMYSGTVGAALTAGVMGSRAVAFSLLRCRGDVDYSLYSIYCEEIINLALRNLKGGGVLNVNIPDSDLKGFKVCRQARVRFTTDVEQRFDLYGHDYYWSVDRLREMEPEAEGTDLAALNSGYISVVPLTYDWTDYKMLNDLKSCL